jgi:predicted nucleic acid-binding protein
MAQPPAPGYLPTAVIDNTLLSRLVDLNLIEFLPLVFRLILIPPEVKREAYRTPHGGKRRLRNLIRETAGFFVDCREADPYITDILRADLGAGESAAIAQADKKESILLIDDEKAYKRAIKMEIRAIRTGRLLNLLKEAGAIREVRPYHEKLAKLGFYMSREISEQLLADAGELSLS